MPSRVDQADAAPADVIVNPTSAVAGGDRVADLKGTDNEKVVADALCADAPNKSSSKRLYEVVVCNLTGKSFELIGDSRPFMRKVAKGRLITLLQTVAAAPAPAPATAPALPRLEQVVRVPSASVDPQIAAKAIFTPCPTGSLLGPVDADLLEFTLAYTAEAGEGFTVRVNAHSHSPIRSGVATVGKAFEVLSELHEVPRLVTRPPLGYEEVALGVYKGPRRCDAERVAQLQPGDEVMATNFREGRWLKISAPVVGWVQSETRDGRPMLEPLVGLRPHLRQVITVRPRHGWYPDTAGQQESEATPGVWSAPEKALSDDLIFSADQHCARSAEAVRLARESAAMEGVALVGRRPRTNLVGVFDV